MDKITKNPVDLAINAIRRNAMMIAQNLPQEAMQKLADMEAERVELKRGLDKINSAQQNVLLNPNYR
jgi:hypothetical protein